METGTNTERTDEVELMKMRYTIVNTPGCQNKFAKLNFKLTGKLKRELI